MSNKGRRDNDSDKARVKPVATSAVEWPRVTVTYDEALSNRCMGIWNALAAARVRDSGKALKFVRIRREILNAMGDGSAYIEARKALLDSHNGKDVNIPGALPQFDKAEDQSAFNVAMERLLVSPVELRIQKLTRDDLVTLTQSTEPPVSIDALAVAPDWLVDWEDVFRSDAPASPPASPADLPTSG